MASNYFAQRLFAKTQPGQAESERVEPTMGATMSSASAEFASSNEPTLGRAASEPLVAQAPDAPLGPVAPVVSTPASTQPASPMPPVASQPAMTQDDALDAMNAKFMALAEKYKLDTPRVPFDAPGVQAPAPHVQFQAQHQPRQVEARQVAEQNDMADEWQEPFRQMSPVNDEEARMAEHALAGSVTPHAHDAFAPRYAVPTVAQPTPVGPITSSASAPSPAKPLDLGAFVETPQIGAFSANSFDDVQPGSMHSDPDDLIISQPKPRTLSADAPASMHTSPHARAHAGVHPDTNRQAEAPQRAGDHGVFVEQRTIRPAANKRGLAVLPIVAAVGIAGAVGLGGAAAYAAFFTQAQDLEIPRIQHDLTDEKVIPSAGERGGYQVPGLDLSVLERDFAALNQFGSTRAAPTPERPLLGRADDITAPDAAASDVAASDATAPDAASPSIITPDAQTAAASPAPSASIDALVPGDAQGATLDVLGALGANTAITLNNDMPTLSLIPLTADANRDANADLGASPGIASTTSQPGVPSLRPAAPAWSSPLTVTTPNTLAIAPDPAIQAPLGSPDLPLADVAQALDFSLVQLTLNTGTAGPASQGSGVFVPSPQNPELASGEIPSQPIPSLVPATQVTDPWGLQVAALGSPDAARRLWQNLRQANLRLLGDIGFKIETILTNGRTLYRLQVGPFPTRATAMDVCAEIQKVEGSIGCFPVTSG